MNDETQKRAITILASVIAYLLASRLADRFVEQPEVRGIRDDLKEALLSAVSSLVLTIIASFVIRQIVGRNRDS
jgi:chromate transport protein ChrA